MLRSNAVLVLALQLCSLVLAWAHEVHMVRPCKIKCDMFFAQTGNHFQTYFTCIHAARVLNVPMLADPADLVWLVKPAPNEREVEALVSKTCSQS